VFLLAVDDQDGRVDVEEQSGGRASVQGHPAQESIVQRAELREGARRHPQEEAAECGGVGVAREPGEGLEDPVLPEELRHLDPFEA
jgi:hypothetical protein